MTSSTGVRLVGARYPPIPVWWQWDPMCWEAMARSPRSLAIMGRQSLVDPIFEAVAFPLGLDRPTDNQLGTAHKDHTGPTPDSFLAL
jgi:hypothetical protein